MAKHSDRARAKAALRRKLRAVKEQLREEHKVGVKARAQRAIEREAEIWDETVARNLGTPGPVQSFLAKYYNTLTNSLLLLVLTVILSVAQLVNLGAAALLTQALVLTGLVIYAASFEYGHTYYSWA